MAEVDLDRWKQEFRAAARADDHAIFRDHLRRLHLDDDPQSLLEATIIVVQRMAAFLDVDGNSERLTQFIQMQTYDPAKAIGACYTFMFDLCGRAHARLMVDKEMRTVDLADLFDSPWDEFQMAGFSNLRISYVDWREMTGEDESHLDDLICADIGVDYSWDEISVNNEGSEDDTYAHFLVYEKRPEDAADEEEERPDADDETVR